MRRRRFLTGTAASRALAAAARTLAQPSRGAMRLVVGFPPGGSVDRIARVLAPELSRVAARSVIVENVPGANSARANARVAASDPTGDTLLVGSSAVAHPDNAAGALALRPVVLASTAPMLLVVRASMPVRDLREFASYVITHPGTVYGSSGIGNPTHLCAAQLLADLRVEAIHVPYSGSSPAFADLVAGRLDFMMTGANSSLGAHPAIRAIAVSTRSRSRLPGLESLPTIAETLVPEFDFGLWQAAYVPAKTPDATVAELLAQFREVLAAASVRGPLAESGVEVVAGPPGEVERMLKLESKRFRTQGAS
jgi:tripartite-type tricarboxylate transporter receptor subunit TctC